MNRDRCVYVEVKVTKPDVVESNVAIGSPGPEEY